MWSAHGLTFQKSYPCSSFKKTWRSLTSKGLLVDCMMPVLPHLSCVGCNAFNRIKGCNAAEPDIKLRSAVMNSIAALEFEHIRSASLGHNCYFEHKVAALDLDLRGLVKVSIAASDLACMLPQWLEELAQDSACVVGCISLASCLRFFCERRDRSRPGPATCWGCFAIPWAILHFSALWLAYTWLSTKALRPCWERKGSLRCNCEG